MLNFLNLLAETASTNDKLAILESAKNDTDKKTFRIILLFYCIS
jgi:hypothetical protein